MRRQLVREVPVPARVILQECDEITCDGCGKELTCDWLEAQENGTTAHELIIVLDQEECVSFERRRDLCDECLEPAWNAINALLGADPDVERDRDYD